MKLRPFASPALGLILLLAACSGGDETLDAGPTDMTDASTDADAGMRALCPLPEHPQRCRTASDCMEDRTKPARCEFCVAANDAICRLGLCETPERLEQVQSILFSFNAPDLVSELVTFARFAVTAETAGGLEISCEDVVSGSVDWAEGCYNVIDSRANPSGMTTGGAFSVLFSQIPSGQKTLFVVYGFALDDADGAPIGVACREALVPERGATDAMMQVSGGDMKSLR